MLARFCQRQNAQSKIPLEFIRTNFRKAKIAQQKSSAMIFATKTLKPRKSFSSYNEVELV